MQAIAVLLALPAHSKFNQGALTYSHPQALPAGTLVRVPLGRKEVLGVVWGAAQSALDAEFALKPISTVFTALAPLNPTWLRLIAFAAQYYQRSLGEMALAALPPQLKDWSEEQLARKLKRLNKAEAQASPEASPALACNPSQNAALQAIANMGQSSAPARPLLLFGRTGSGKTEVYLQATAHALAQAATAQVLVLVPEINLTPQLEAQFQRRFAALGPQAVVRMHSGLTEAQRSSAWLLAHSGQARIVLGTRLAVFASLPDLRLIVVDEEHDASYKAQDGARHSARDLAVYRAKLESERLQTQQCPVVLGSATPSLESWQAAQEGRYQLLELPERIGGGQLTPVRLVDMRLQPKGHSISTVLLAALQERIGRGEQSLLLLNRRGYAPVLACGSCGWKSACPHCSAYQVFHKSDRSLRCHHCGDARAVPAACPECGDLDIAPLGRGTEKLEEDLASLLAESRRPDGQPARVLRMDADSVKKAGGLEQQLAQMHSGEVDVLVGTQMVAKGHDFRRITLVAAINPDGGLFAGDYRAPERMAALLMQAAGRAGRDAAMSERTQMLVQTHNPEHPLYTWLMRHDWAGFAHSQLQEREMAAMPPFSHQALLRAEARTQDAAQGFLQAALQLAEELSQTQPEYAAIALYAPVPMAMQRVANVERAQLLLEAESRLLLQKFLSAWRAQFGRIKAPGLLRWALDVDPAAV